MPRFVLLRHDCPPSFPRPSHWDFMLETGEVLRTWVLMELPADWQTLLGITPSGFQEKVSAQQIGDHRREYLTLEGPLSGDRGTVTRIEEGEYTVVAESEDQLEIRLSGKRLRGTAVMSRDATGADHWSLVWRSD